jgi:hypothetical protein
MHSASPSMSGGVTSSLQAQTGSGVLVIDRAAPVFRVFLVDELRHRYRREVRIAHELGSIVEGTAITLRNQMDRFRLGFPLPDYAQPCKKTPQKYLRPPMMDWTD